MLLVLFSFSCVCNSTERIEWTEMDRLGGGNGRAGPEPASVRVMHQPAAGLRNETTSPAKTHKKRVVARSLMRRDADNREKKKLTNK